MGKVILYLAALVALWMLLPDRVKPTPEPVKDEPDSFSVILRVDGLPFQWSADNLRDKLLRSMEEYSGLTLQWSAVSGPEGALKDV